MSDSQARLGDGTSHGGVIISASTDVYTNGIANARIGDLVLCPLHGVNEIVSGSDAVFTNGMANARIGDSTVCGSVIVAGSVDRYVGSSSGQPVDMTPSVAGFQPWVTVTDAAISSSEEPGPLTLKQKELFNMANLPLDTKNPNPPVDDKTPPSSTPNPIVPKDCSAFASMTEFPPSLPLSSNFNLGSVSTNALREHSVPMAQAGFTLPQIICNLKDLCVNLLEPITAKYGRPNINCGFRSINAEYGSAKSNHKNGYAADLQWGGISDQEYYDRACWIRDTLQYCELILEYGGNRPWIHVAYSASGLNRTKVMSRITVPNGFVMGIVRCTNQPNVGGTKL